MTDTELPHPQAENHEHKPKRGRRRTTEQGQTADQPQPNGSAHPEEQEGTQPLANGIDHVLQLARERFGKQNADGDAPEKITLPDPHLTQSIALTAEPDGPKMRLFRSNAHREMLIVFDKKPEGEIGGLVFEALKDHGFRWNGNAWAKRLDPQARWRSTAEAEKLFKDIGDTLREANGLRPTLGFGMQT